MSQSSLCRAKDVNKDQSYFLWQLKAKHLTRVLFPIGEFENKEQVRQYAQEKGLLTAAKKDSQGLCFIGQTPLRELLLQTLGEKLGLILEEVGEEDFLKRKKKKNRLWQESQDFSGAKIGDFLETKGTKWQVLGQHQGAYLYTPGQREGLKLGGGPWFVWQTDVQKNLVFVVSKAQENKLYAQKLLIGQTNWQLDLEKFFESVQKKETLPEIAEETLKNGFGLKKERKEENSLELFCQAQVRYRQTPVNCRVQFKENDFCEVEFSQSVRAPSVGQSLVFYAGEVLLGGGIIEEILEV